MIPLPDDSVDGAIVVLAVHHFEDRPAAFREIVRVAGSGPVVLFTFDPSAFEQFWLARYFPQIGRRFRSLPWELSNIEAEIRRETARKVRRVCFPLPPDLQDRFGAASWSCPEAYLKPEIREGISDFALMDSNDIERGLEHLRKELESGRWDREYGALRALESYDVGYRFLVVEPDA
jgi:SAM-dependent methyltransferase